MIIAYFTSMYWLYYELSHGGNGLLQKQTNVTWSLKKFTLVSASGVLR